MAFLGSRTRIRAHGTTNSRVLKNAGRQRPFSFIRTLTVGFGFTPNLLTLNRREKSFWRKIPWDKALAGLGLIDPYRRWGLSPRPENIGRPGLNGLQTNMTAVGRRSKRLPAPETHGAMPRERVSPPGLRLFVGAAVND